MSRRCLSLLALTALLSLAVALIHATLALPQTLNGFGRRPGARRRSFRSGDFTEFMRSPHRGAAAEPPPPGFVAELLQSFSEGGRATGPPRSAWDVHTQGLYLSDAMAMVTTERGELLLQRGSAEKWVWPGAWDVAVADGPWVLRWEKLRGGPRPNCWKGRMPKMNLFDCHLAQLYGVRLKGGALAHVKLQKEEVSGLTAVSFAEANRIVAQAPENFTRWALDAAYNGGLALFAPLRAAASQCGAGCDGLGRGDRCVAHCVRLAAISGTLQLKTDDNAAANTCTFHAGRDYADPAVPGTEHGLNAASAVACCALCFARPTCAAAAYAGGRCYPKVSAAAPKGAGGVVGCATGRGPPPPPPDVYDCRFRHLALDFASSQVLAAWSQSRAAAARRDVANGLRIDQCNRSAAAAPPAARSRPAAGALPTQVRLFVAPDGDDSAAGTAAAPLRSIGGAQAHIRKAYAVGSRPAIAVSLRGGDYYVPARVGSAFVAGSTFGDADSGSSAAAPIVYGAEVDGATGLPARVTLHGGLLLSARNFSWSAGAVPGSWQATLPPGVEVDLQDQLFLGDAPLVRARIPNGRPWLPLDGFNLTAGFGTAETKLPLPNVPRIATVCDAGAPAPVKPHPPPPGPRPKAPPQPALGNCSAPEGGISLLAGSPLKPPDFLMVGKRPSASACEAACLAQPCCSGFTWHDNKQSSWLHDCYLVTNPLDVWTRRAGKSSPGHVSAICNHGPTRLPCSGGGGGGAECVSAEVQCASTEETMVRGPVAPSTFGSGGSATISMSRCYAHLPDMGNSWPLWKAAGYGLLNASSTDVNTLTFDQNFPLWQGPWASGLVMNNSQDAGNAGGIKALPWSDADQGRMVVHSMADGEWGGVQFQVANATKRPNGDALLRFSQGGWQQARGAELEAGGGFGGIGNRFYIEGSIDFLDQEGEWHFDAATRALTVVPPRGTSKAQLQAMAMVLTQTDSLLRFAGSGDAAEPGGGRVQHVHVVNLTLAHTSAQFFLPHEETSGGDYAVTRSGAVFAENASSLLLQGNDLVHIGGNAVFLSNSVANVTIAENRMSFLGTSGVSIVGRTGASLMDARDGEAMVAAGGKDNGVRLPKHNVVTQNVISDYGVWDKQTAAFHKALAPGNAFTHNVVFNSSRHGVNFQDSMGGQGLVAFNLFFNLNRETKDTAALNSWGRRTYMFSQQSDPTQPQLVPALSELNRWRNNLVLGRNFWGVRDGNGDCLRCDDGASWYNMSENVCYTPLAASQHSAMEFNGGTQVFTHANLFVNGGWTLCAAPPGEGGGSHDIFIDSPFFWHSVCGDNKCLPLWESNNATHQTSPGMCKNLTHGCKPAILKSDQNTLVLNSSGQATATPDLSKFFCGMNLSTWRQRTKADTHTQIVAGGGTGEWSPNAVLARARTIIFSDALD